jgi:hypothetical protein
MEYLSLAAVRAKKRYYEKNKASLNAKSKAYYHANKETASDKAKIYYQNNKAKIQARQQEYYQNNKAKIQDHYRDNPIHAEYMKVWRQNNSHKTRGYCAKRRASKLLATPGWLTAEQHAQIEQIYFKAFVMEQETGTKYEVDHIVPLQGAEVSGLHVPWNLQILTVADNRRKGNNNATDGFSIF